MMYIPSVNDCDSEPHEEVAQKFIAEGRREKIKSEIEQLVGDEFDRLEEYAAEHITRVAADRAERFLERVLAGDENAAMELLGSRGDAGRYCTGGYDEGKPWASLIHGRLFETKEMQLRRDIVEAHKDLLVSERIKDLESVVEGLTQQVRKLEHDLEHCRGTP